MFTVSNFNFKKVPWHVHVFDHKLSLKVFFNFLNTIIITSSQQNIININNKNHTTTRSPTDKNKIIRITLLKPDIRDNTAELIKSGSQTFFKAIYRLLKLARYILLLRNIPRRLLHIDLLKVSHVRRHSSHSAKTLVIDG